MMMTGNISKRNQVGPEWGVKGKSKHVLYLGETATSVLITDTQAVHRIRSLRARGPDESSYSA